MGLGQLPALRLVEFRETQGQIDVNNTPPVRARDVEQQAEAAAKRGDQRERQEMQQPEQGYGGQAKESVQHGCCGVRQAADAAPEKLEIKMKASIVMRVWREKLDLRGGRRFAESGRGIVLPFAIDHHL
jgi:hypothetical protein